jgi:hypothetical protein
MLTQIRDFPAAYPLIREKVDSIYWYALSKEQEDPNLDPETASWMDYRYLDYFVGLKNGDTYSFTGHMLDQMREVMEEEGLKSWVEVGGVVLREISIECILDAVENWLAKCEIYGLPNIAVLQTRLNGEETKYTGDNGC